METRLTVFGFPTAQSPLSARPEVVSINSGGGSGVVVVVVVVVVVAFSSLSTILGECSPPALFFFQ